MGADGGIEQKHGYNNRYNLQYDLWALKSRRNKT